MHSLVRYKQITYKCLIFGEFGHKKKLFHDNKLFHYELCKMFVSVDAGHGILRLNGLPEFSQHNNSYILTHFAELMHSNSNNNCSNNNTMVYKQQIEKIASQCWGARETKTKCAAQFIIIFNNHIFLLLSSFNAFIILR